MVTMTRIKTMTGKRISSRKIKKTHWKRRTSRMAEVKSSLFRTSAKELKPATWTRLMIIITLLLLLLIIMISMVIRMGMMVTSLVHLIMIGQNGCKDGRERCRSSLIIILNYDYNDDDDHYIMIRTAVRRSTCCIMIMIGHCDVVVIIKRNQRNHDNDDKKEEWGRTGVYDWWWRKSKFDLRFTTRMQLCHVEEDHILNQDSQPVLQFLKVEMCPHFWQRPFFGGFYSNLLLATT